LSGLAESAI